MWVFIAQNFLYLIRQRGVFLAVWGGLSLCGFVYVAPPFVPLLMAKDLSTGTLTRDEPHFEGGLVRCWPKGQLAVRPKEWQARRGRGAYSVAKLKGHKLPNRSPIAVPYQGSIRRVTLPPGVKLLALTFDLCEGPFEIAGYDGRVIDYLRAHNVPATLFVGGKWLMSHPERAEQLMMDPLFELGAHGWSHRNFRRLSGPAVRRSLQLTAQAFQHVQQSLYSRACVQAEDSEPPRKPLRLFRFPYGTCLPAALRAVNEFGQMAIQWDVVSGDPALGQSARRIARAVLARVRPGSIVVMHANGRGWHTAKALPLIVPKLRAMGYRFVTVGELLNAGQPLTVKQCYENRPGDNKHY